jgi:hypothetical protein
VPLKVGLAVPDVVLPITAPTFETLVPSEKRKYAPADWLTTELEKNPTADKKYVPPGADAS